MATVTSPHTIVLRPARTAPPGAAARHRRARLQRRARPGAQRAAAARLPHREPAVHVPRDDRRQRQRRPDLADRPVAGRAPARRARRAPRREGPRPRPARRLAGKRRRACSPTWTSTCPPTWPRCCPWSRRCCRGTPTWPSAPAWRAPRWWSAAPGARSSHAATTCCCAPLWEPASRTPSAASRRSAPTGRASSCRWSKTPAGSSTPSCSCWPSAPACASTKCRSTGSTTPIRGSTSSPRRWPT